MNPNDHTRPTANGGGYRPRYGASRGRGLAHEANTADAYRHKGARGGNPRRKNETTERNKIFQNSMNVYVQRLYEAAAAHADARWKREAIIERAIYAISVMILLIAVGIASYDQGEKSGAAKAIPAVVQTAPAATAESQPPSAKPKRQHRP